MTDFTLESVFTYRGRTCAVSHNTSLHHSWRCGYVMSKFNKVYSDYMYRKLSEEATYSGDLQEVYPEVPCGQYIGFDTNHSHDTPMSSSKGVVAKRLMEFADSLIKAEETTESYKDRPCYLAGPIQHFSEHRDVYEKVKNDPKKLKEYLFANWSEAYSWAVKAVLKLKELGFIKVFSPHLYTIPFAKRIYDTAGDDRDFWIAINFNIIELINNVGCGCHDTEGFMLISTRAFSRVQGELIWHSSGSKEEWQYCVDNDMDCFIYEAFIEGELVHL